MVKSPEIELALRERTFLKDQVRALQQSEGRNSVLD